MRKLLKEYPVIIVGAGPVGLALANELGWRGINYLLVDQSDGSVTFPAGENIFSRTMEHLRRWGIADQIRYSDAFPAKMPRTMGFATSLHGRMLAVFEGISNADGPALDPYSPEGPLFYPKRSFDPALLRGALRHSVGTVCHALTLVSVEQTPEYVTTKLVDAPSGDEHDVRCAYLAGCDGGRSMVRKSLGIPYIGAFGEGYNFAVHFRSQGLASWLRQRFGADFAQIHTINTPRRPYITAVDGRSEWRLSMYMQSEDAPIPEIAIREAIDPRLDFEILSAQPWSGHRVVARDYNVGRVFLAGDAAHLRWPKGGFGANTGFGDAVDLGWKLAAVLCGWGGRHLLESYQSERRPIAVRNTNEAANNRVLDAMIEPDPLLDEDGEIGDRARARMANRLFALRQREFNTTGIQLGYRYRSSPICIQDESLEPPDDHMLYRPSTFPGGRAPHAWIAPGRSTLDLFGRGFTLLVFDRTVEYGPIMAAARRINVPISVEEISNPDIAEMYERPLVLVRPDGHVAWRSDAAAADPEAIVSQITGSRTPASCKR